MAARATQHPPQVFAAEIGRLLRFVDRPELAVDRALRYQSYWNEAERYAVDESQGHFSVRYESWGPSRPAHVQLAEKMVAQSVRFVRAAVPDCLPEAISFPHAPRPGSVAVAQALGREPMYGAPYTEVAFRSPVLDARLPTADTVLFQVLDRELALRIRDLTPASAFADHVRKAIADYLHREQLSVVTVARALGTNERIVEQRLTDERTSFRDLVDEVRRSRAIALIDTVASLPELAVHLGYSEEATLHSAFNRWTGATPESWRARQPIGAPGRT